MNENINNTTETIEVTEPVLEANATPEKTLTSGEGLACVFVGAVIGAAATATVDMLVVPGAKKVKGFVSGKWNSFKAKKAAKAENVIIVETTEQEETK